MSAERASLPNVADASERLVSIQKLGGCLVDDKGFGKRMTCLFSSGIYAIFLPNVGSSWRPSNQIRTLIAAMENYMVSFERLRGRFFHELNGLVSSTR